MIVHYDKGRDVIMHESLGAIGLVAATHLTVETFLARLSGLNRTY